MILEHEHLIVRAEYTTPIRDNEAAEAWLADLIKAIGMEVLVGPFSIYSDMVGNTGITAGAILSTSHCVLHTFEDENHSVLQLDLYSCSTFSIFDVLERTQKFFNPYKLEYKFLDRKRNLKFVIDFPAKKLYKNEINNNREVSNSGQDTRSNSLVSRIRSLYTRTASRFPTILEKLR
jgi:S-adenosylmethionine/arginine decarboxylase-like enzyme